MTWNEKKRGAEKRYPSDAGTYRDYQYLDDEAKARVDRLVGKFRKKPTPDKPKSYPKDGGVSITPAVEGVDFVVDRNKPRSKDRQRTLFGLWAMGDLTNPKNANTPEGLHFGVEEFAGKLDPPFRFERDKWHDFGDLFNTSSPETKTEIFNKSKDKYCPGCHSYFKASLPKSWHGYCRRCSDELVGGRDRHYSPSTRKRVSFPFDSDFDVSTKGQAADDNPGE